MKIIKRILLGFILSVLAICSLVWMLSPLLVRSVLQGPLDAQGLVLDEKSSVRLNLFRSTLHVIDFAVYKDSEKTYELEALSLQYSLWSLLKKEIRVQQIVLKGMNVQVELSGESLIVAGIDLNAFSGKPEEKEGGNGEPNNTESFSYKVIVPEIVLESIQFYISNNTYKHKILVDRLTLDKTEFFEQALSSQISFKGEIDTSTLEFDASLASEGEALKLALELEWEKISPQSITYLLPENIKKLGAVSDFNIRTNLSFANDVLSLKSTNVGLQVDAVEYVDDNLNVQLEKAEFSVGSLETECDVSANDILFLNSSSVGLQVDAVDYVDDNLNIQLEKTEFSLGNLEAQFDKQKTEYEVSANMELQLAGLNSALEKNGDTLAQLEKLQIEKTDLKAKNGKYTVDSPKVFLEGILLSSAKTGSDKKQPLYESDYISVNNLSLTNDLIRVDNVRMGGGESNLVLDKSGEFVTLVDVESLQESNKAEKRVAAEDQQETSENEISDGSAKPSATPRLVLNSFALDKAFKVKISDQSNNHSFKKTFEVSRLEIDAVDSGNVEQKTEFFLDVKDEEYFTSNLEGWAQPFKKTLNLSTKGKAKEFPLYEVAPYLRDSLGFEVEAGQLDADLTADIIDDQLASNAILFMRGAKFKSSQKVNDEANLIGQTAIPLNVALNMLKDGDGNIKLKIPVKGDVKDPSFGIAPVIGLVVKKVAMSQAKSYLMTMFVPYAKVVSVALTAGEEALKVRFEDLAYMPAQVDPAESQNEFIEQFSLLMKEKDDLRVSVCPVSTPEDIQLSPGTKLSEEQYLQLTEIAKARGKAFKAYVVSRSGIDSTRLLLCSAKVDSATKAVPRIDFKT